MYDNCSFLCYTTIVCPNRPCQISTFSQGLPSSFVYNDIQGWLILD